MTEHPNTPQLETPAPFGGPGGHPNYRANQEKARHHGFPVCQTECCCYCGKKAVNPKRYAFLTAMGEWTTADTVDDNDCLGFYPLGTACAAKLRKLGVPVYKTPAKFGHPDFKPTLMATPKGVTPLVAEAT